MRNGVNALLACWAAAMLQAFLPGAAAADPPSTAAAVPPEERALQGGEDRWVPSLAITGGANFQKQEGFANSVTEQLPGSPAVPLRGVVTGDDLVVAPFVGAALEIMTPALAVPTRPRFFAGAEILPSFASERILAVEGDPGCVRGPEADAPCAVEEQPGDRVTAFGENSANGEGTKVTGQVGTLVFGANMGVAFPFQLAGRQLRIKPSVAWISYEVEATGLVVDATCNPPNRCTDTTSPTGLVREGNLRETTLTGQGSQRFNGVGAGVDLEVDTGRFGPIGTSLFLGGRFYSILGDRSIDFGAAASYPPLPAAPPATEPIPAADSAARFQVEVNPWLYRAHVGIRFEWLGSRD
jgi:hypothetical protein